MKNLSRRRWLLALPLLLLAVAAFVRWRTPRPSSPANVWLWEQSAKAARQGISVKVGLVKAQVGLSESQGLSIKNHKNCVQLLRSLSCSGDFQTPTSKNYISGEPYLFEIWTSQQYVYVCEVHGHYWLSRTEDNRVAQLRPDSLKRFLVLLHQLTAEVKTKKSNNSIYEISGT